MFEQEKYKGEDEFHSPVRSVHIETAKIFKRNDSYIEDAHILSRQIIFDEDGRKIEETFLSPGGSRITKNAFTYDAGGRLAEVKQYNDEQFSNKTQYNYDDTGKLEMELSQTVDGALLNKAVYSYDTHGNKTEVAHYDSDGSLSVKLVSKIDGQGRIIETAFCGGRRSSGLLIRDNGAGSRMLSIDKTQMAEGSICGEGYLLTRFIMTYDGGGNETAILQYKGDGALLGRLVFVGDERSKELEMIRYYADDSLQSKEKHIREFDSQANWVKDTELTWNINIGIYEPTKATFRHLIY
jgi:hypothetical protein